MMKKLRLLTVILTLSLLTMVVPLNNVVATPDVTVKVDGQVLTFPDQKPYIDKANRTMVPVRTPMEAIGCKVDWNEQARKAIISKGDTTAEFTINSNTYTVNGVKKTMDTKAVIAGDRTAFPIRFAAEAMGATVGWDADTYTVLISTKASPIETKVVDIPKSSDAFDEQYIKVADYTLWVGNQGVNNPGIWFGMSDSSNYPLKDIKVVCTSHPEWNKSIHPMWDGTKKEFPNDVWTNSF